MRKSCSFVILLSFFFIGVVYYIWQKYGDGIQESAKNKILQVVSENLNEKILGIDPDVDTKALFESISEMIIEKGKDLPAPDLENFAQDIINNISKEIDKSDYGLPDLSEIKKIIQDYERD